jgi:hypothetical protein
MKRFRIYGNYYFGVWLSGIVFFLIQELPYAVMPFLSLPANPLMEMKTYSYFLEIPEKLFGILTVVLLVLLMNDKSAGLPFKNLRDKTFFFLALFFLAVYFTGWWFYFSGIQSITLILSYLVAMPPLYYMSLGLWKKNRPLVVNTVFFLIFHIANVWTSLNTRIDFSVLQSTDTEIIRQCMSVVVKIVILMWLK